ncbi:WD repeat domain phosphoinositide-interacting protein 4-like isoform X2 [Halichondria panicea]|uniref:WD repeat domain phosphoinositide-interacting protein 4-like isoform X2 n=1 Tax=Halichondria panicea TaxID=6063 RepID=UPI00312B5F24
MPVSKGILKIRFNQDHGCFICAMESGVQVYNVEPLAEKGRIDFDLVGGVGCAEMLGRSNLIALIGGGQAPKFPDRNVMIWDDKKRKFVYEFGFPSRVVTVRMRRDKLVVILMSEIHVFSFPDNPEQLASIATAPNPRGLCEVCSSVDCQLMAFPGSQKGTVQIVDLLSTKAPDRAATEIICHVHQHVVSFISMNQSGTLVATCSTKGTLIRIHNTQTRNLVAEFRRGADSANIYCLNFSLDSAFLCCSSDKGTVHIFAVKEQSLNKKSSLAQVSLLGMTMGPYVDSQWGLAQFSLPNESPCVCAFIGDKKSVVAICTDGTLHKYGFTTEGNSTRESYDVFLNIGDDQM